MIAPLNGRKVFGLGLNKTGTTSLGDALNLLGIRTVHYPFKTSTYRELTSGCFRLSILDKYQAIVDTPVAPYYPQLDACYPGSKFILTVREPESWLRSIEAHWPVMREWCARDPQFGRFSEFISAVVYGCIEFNRDRFLYAYETHLRNVRHYFRDRPGDLLELDICRGGSWEPICSFLGLPIPDVPFPHSNQGRRRGDAREWIQTFDLAKRDLAEVLGPNDRPILVDEDKVGESVTPGGRALPFPERNGCYQGPPPDDESAIRELQRLERAGADHLIFTWGTFWWLEHYHGFHAWLQTHRECILRNERVVVYRLARTEIGERKELSCQRL